MVNKYPYTDFNEYNLDWLIVRIKELTEQWAAYKTQMDADWLEYKTGLNSEWAAVQDDWQLMKSDLTELKDYITSFFDNLDVQQEINNKIDEMVADGSLLALIQNTVVSTATSATEAWLTEHVNPQTGYVVDNTLSIAGAAADAKATGDAVNALSNSIDFLNTGVNNNILLKDGTPVFTSIVSKFNLYFSPNAQDAGAKIADVSATENTKYYFYFKNGDTDAPAENKKYTLYIVGKDSENTTTGTKLTTGEKLTSFVTPSDTVKIEVYFRCEYSSIDSGADYDLFAYGFEIWSGNYIINDDFISIPKLDDIEEIVYSDVNLPSPRNNWIRYSTGELVASDATRMYVFTSNLPKAIRAFLTSDSPVLCAIAFYNSTTISTDSYMPDASVQFASGTHNDGLWYSAIVPDGCRLIAITTKAPSESVVSPVITFDAASVLNYKISDTPFNYPLTGGENAWIRHGTGEKVSSEATRLYTFRNVGYKKIIVFTKTDTTAIDAVAFYTGDTISTLTYMNESVPWKGGETSAGGWYIVDVPDTAKTIAVSVIKASGSYNPAIQFLVDDIIKLIDGRYSFKDVDVLSSFGKYIYHYGMSGVADRSEPVTIPSESVYDIRNAHNLGFRCIEANVHKTLDGKYVVTHGIDGNLGHDFNDLNGDDAYGVSIAENTLQDLRENYVYRSTNPDFRTPITTLEEFCEESKKLNMIVMFQYVDETEAAIIKGIMNNNFFLYNGKRDYYKGPILEYHSYATKAQILERCDQIGQPYIYSMGNISDFSDADLADIINEIHLRGCHIAGSYVNSADLPTLSAMGFDFFAVDIGDTSRDVILDAKRLIFNDDGTINWVAASLT